MRPVPYTRSRELFERWSGPALAGLTVALLAANNGGYFPTAWGWTAVVALWLSALVLAFGWATEIAPLESAFLAAFAAIAAWTAASLLWTESTAATVLETERAIAYLGGIAAVLLLARRRHVSTLAAALFAAGVLVGLYALGTRLFPDHLGAYDPVATYRLSDPIGYWNGLGIFVVFTILLGLGFAARSRWIVARALAGASLVFLLPTVYFTFSRGAWLALGLALVVALLVDPHRLQLAATATVSAPAPAVAVVLAARSHGLTHAHVPVHEALHDGHALALRLLPLALLGAALVVAQALVERRWRPARQLQVAFGAALVVIPVVAVVAAVVHYGGPTKVATRAYDSFKTRPSRSFIRDPNLNARLLKLTGNGRVQYWHVAWREYTAHEALGSGAGTYAHYWYRDRDTGANAQDAHGLYIETLAELGPVGLLLVVVALLLPFAAVARARDHPLAAVLTGAYAAFVLHAGVDWDRELTAVGFAGLFCGAAIMVAARSGEEARVPAAPLRVGAAVVVACLGAFALYALIGNSAVSASARALDDGNVTEAAKQARRAKSLMPWSPQPWVALGNAQAAAGERGAAVGSFRRAAAKDPGDWTLWYDLAVVADGRVRSRALARAVRLNPRSYELQDLRRKITR